MLAAEQAAPRAAPLASVALRGVLVPLAAVAPRLPRYPRIPPPDVCQSVGLRRALGPYLVFYNFFVCLDTLADFLHPPLQHKSLAAHTGVAAKQN